MATQKDFIPMADALKELGDRPSTDRYTWLRCVDTVADAFFEGNTRFDYERFRNACDYYKIRAEATEANNNTDPVSGIKGNFDG